MPDTTKHGFRRVWPVPSLPWGRPSANPDVPSSLLAFPQQSQRAAGAGLWHEGHLGRMAVIAWCIIALMSVGRAALLQSPRHCGCYHIYAEAGRAWLAGNDLYSAEPGLTVYRYSPLVAVLLAPIGALPNMLGCAVLRAVNLGMFILAIYWWSKCAAPWELSRRQRAAFLLLVAPLVARSLIDVQVNGITIALLLLGVTALVDNRANWATVCIVLACLVKAYVISFALVLILLYPRQLLLRFVAIAALGLALPLAFQRPDYVLRQYELWVRWGLNHRGSNEFEDLWFLLARMGISWNQHMHSIVQLAAAAGVALFCLRRRLARVPRKQLAATALGLTCGWMMLLGPATEGCTYVLLAPAMAWVVLEACATEAPAWQQALGLSAFVVFTVGQIAFWFPWGGALNGIGTFPFTAILTVAAIIAAELRSSQPAPASAAGGEETLAFPLAAVAVREAHVGQGRKAA